MSDKIIFEDVNVVTIPREFFERLLRAEERIEKNRANSRGYYEKMRLNRETKKSNAGRPAMTSVKDIPVVHHQVSLNVVQEPVLAKVEPKVEYKSVQKLVPVPMTVKNMTVPVGWEPVPLHRKLNFED